MSPQTIFYLIFGIITFGYLLDLFLDYLNQRRWSADLPAELAPYYDAEQYRKSQQYHKENNRVSAVSDTISYVLTSIFLWLGGFGWLSEWLKHYIANPIWLALVYFAILSLATSLINLPFSIYHTFIIEEKYGFNRTSWKTWLIDRLKGLLLGAIVGGALGYLLLWLIFTLGQNFWIYAWLVSSVVVLFLNMFYTTLIVPIFNKLKPLEAGSLRQAIEDYAKRVQFPLTNVYVIDGSKRSTKANAYFSGIGSQKKIVLFDTLIEKHTEEELVSVLAHEVGHYKRRHIIKGLIISLVQMAVMFWLVSLLLFSEKLSVALGVPIGAAPQAAIHVNLIAIGILFGPVSLLIGIAMNVLSRKHEYEADAYAAETANKEAFKDALIRLSTDNLSNLNPHPAYVFFHYSHPPLLSRIKALK